MLHVLNFPPLRMDQQIVQQKPHKLDFLLPSHCQGVVLETAHIQTPIEEAQLAESDEIIRVTVCHSISQCQSHLLFLLLSKPGKTNSIDLCGSECADHLGPTMEAERSVTAADLLHREHVVQV